jgi:elongator complex protein 3
MPTIQLSKWSDAQGRTNDVTTNVAELVQVLERIRDAKSWNNKTYLAIVNGHARQTGRLFSKTELMDGYRKLVARGIMPADHTLAQRLLRKPVRTHSGVAPVTVLTKPYDCPGDCLFCPTFVRLPKSYLPDEPGAMRALQNDFDPYRQVQSRLNSFRATGHTANKVELLILGGTWSAYPKKYREWFVQRCLDAMNGVDSASLAEAQRLNENAAFRNVGLVIETRPDTITRREIMHLRQLGVTKVQMGIQSMDDRLLALNQRGHTVEDTRRAFGLLRAAGFKLVGHWMANLYGADVASDYADFQKLFDDPAIRPDELKIYPTSLLKEAELYQRYQEGLYKPYDEQTLIELIARCKLHVPRYTRINRIFRDIPSPNIVEGNKKTNLRQLVQQYMVKHEMGQCQCLRCREVRRQEISSDALRLAVLPYETSVSHEYFISFVTPEDKVAGFLRLSLPLAPELVPIDEIKQAAMIREVHVYGPALNLGKDSRGEAQHRGLGGRLIAQAEKLARAAGFSQLAVISAIGTRQYYRHHGFEMTDFYMMKALA